MQKQHSRRCDHRYRGQWQPPRDARPGELCRRQSFLIAIAGCASPASAQSYELSPFYGYRFGGGFVDLYTAQPFDFDGAPATGVVFDVRLYDSDDFQIEGLFTHQAATVLVAPGAGRPVSEWRVSADHWLAGGLQEFSAAARWSASRRGCWD